MSKISVAQFNALSAKTLPIAQVFGLTLEKLDPGRAVVRMPFRPELTRPGGTVAGPAMMGLADYTMYAVLMSLIGHVEMAVTINLNTNFLRRPGAADLIADGRMIKLGKRLAFMEVTLYSEGDTDPVAHATGTYSIPPHPSPQRRRAGAKNARGKRG